MLKRSALVRKAWTPRCRHWIQRIIVFRDRRHVQGYARRARAQPHILQQAIFVWVLGRAKRGERAPIPQLGTLAMMSAGKLPLAWSLFILHAIRKPSDFHPLLFVHVSAFAFVTTLRLSEVTFPKVREFGRLVCKDPGKRTERPVKPLFFGYVAARLVGSYKELEKNVGWVPSRNSYGLGSVNDAAGGANIYRP
ncbi:hypothetical protein WOLCODRAFT_163997 [Wolfiporia cocos MD-104 SS10]|uniref:Uncharacterized protein n=1 Tax=Wolfiporia cocos (strain MD-104) TaxID=742152 RepID=A0A2H3JY14_WOLCO|nr:hypothetical protein WOLCODRAFT_163997 [Wolfiporia cocos MD-104 SS10]